MSMISYYGNRYWFSYDVTTHVVFNRIPHNIHRPVYGLKKSEVRGMYFALNDSHKLSTRRD